MKQNVLITGAGGTLGKACVDHFLGLQYQVIGTVSPGKKNTLQRSGSFETREVNLSDESQCIGLVNDVIELHRSIDAALLLAGGFGMDNIEKTSITDIRKMFQLNFETAFNIARPVFLQMKKQTHGGRIVLVGARPSLDPAVGKDMISYALSKSLLFKLAEMFNAEGQQSNVVTSVIVPSTIDTPDNRASMPNADFNRWVKPEEIAATLSHLCSRPGSVLRDPILKVYGGA
jgi:NAD(P)-dependent dehydrogenase (short-subunit alcohol dehydrogenase family)